MKKDLFFINNPPTGQDNKKLVLVTGGNKGIGKAICKGLLLQHPSIHVILGSRDLDNGQRASSEIATAVASGGNDVCGEGGPPSNKGQQQD